MDSLFLPELGVVLSPLHLSPGGFKLRLPQTFLLSLRHHIPGMPMASPNPKPSWPSCLKGFPLLPPPPRCFWIPIPHFPSRGTEKEPGGGGEPHTRATSPCSLAALGQQGELKASLTFNVPRSAKCRH